MATVAQPAYVETTMYNIIYWLILAYITGGLVSSYYKYQLSNKQCSTQIDVNKCMKTPQCSVVRVHDHSTCITISSPHLNTTKQMMVTNSNGKDMATPT